MKLDLQDRVRKLNLLTQHHSSGPQYNQAFARRFAKTIAKMAPKQSRPKMSWRCYPCWRLVTETAQKCPQCEGWWQDVADPNYVHVPPQHHPQPQAPSQPMWSWNAWSSTALQTQDQPRKDPRARSTSHKAKGRKQKGRGKGNQEMPEQAAPMANPFGTSDQVSPFLLAQSSTYSATAMPAAPWPPVAKPTAPVKPAPNTSASEVNIDPETLQVLKSSYPDMTQAPQAIREMVEKAEKAALKVWEDDLGDATQKLKESRAILANIKMAKEKHRQEWMQHLESSATLWKDMIDSYTAQQAHFNALIDKTKKDMKTAGQTVTVLNRKADQALSSRENGDDDNVKVEIEAEKETKESAMRERIQNLLQQSIDLTREDDTIDVDLEEDEQGPKKRARSADPQEFKSS